MSERREGEGGSRSDAGESTFKKATHLGRNTIDPTQCRVWAIVGSSDGTVGPLPLVSLCSELYGKGGEAKPFASLVHRSRRSMGVWDGVAWLAPLAGLGRRDLALAPTTLLGRPGFGEHARCKATNWLLSDGMAIAP